MKIFYFIFIGGFLLSSCATLIHQSSVDVNVHSDIDSVKICVNNDRSKWYDTPALINVERSGNDLLLTARKDSTEKFVRVNSNLSNAFWFGNMFSGAGIIGYAIDLTNPKKICNLQEGTKL